MPTSNGEQPDRAAIIEALARKIWLERGIPMPEARRQAAAAYDRLIAEPTTKEKERGS